MGRGSERDTPREDGLTRRDVLVRAAGAGAVLIAGTRALGLAGTAEAATSTAKVRRFVSRPDLQPPVVTVVHRTAAAAPGLLFLAPSSGPGQRGAMILDETGEVVWFHPTTPRTCMNLRAGLYKGRPVLTWWEGRYVEGVGRVGEYVLMDSTYRQIARFTAAHELRPDFHELLLTPQGTALTTTFDPVVTDLSSVGGPKNGRAFDGVVHELALPSGRVLFEWRSLDHVPVTESYQTEVGNPYDYFHVNSIDIDHDGDLLVSARNTWAVYKIGRHSGRVVWRLGGKKSDFALGPGAQFVFQHDARSHDRGRRISIFDNGPHPSATPHSRAIVLALDERRRHATLERQIVHTPPLFAKVTGNAQLLGNGDYLVCWGSTGWFSEYGQHGDVRLDAHLPPGGQNYRVFRFPWVGKPSEPPAAKATRGGRTLHVSWNGATEVHSWRLLAGRQAARLQTAATVPRSGFETVIPVPAGSRYAAAVALDSKGKPLGRTKTIPL
jgi:hypothetical protein